MESAGRCDLWRCDPNLLFARHIQSPTSNTEHILLPTGHGSPTESFFIPPISSTTANLPSSSLVFFPHYSSTTSQYLFVCFFFTAHFFLPESMFGSLRVGVFRRGPGAGRGGGPVLAAHPLTADRGALPAGETAQAHVLLPHRVCPASNHMARTQAISPPR